MNVSANYAGMHIEELLSALDGGEEVQIERADKPAVRLTLVGHTLEKVEPEVRPRSELFGSMRGKIWLSDDWDSPETNAEIADLFNSSNIFPDEPGR